MSTPPRLVRELQELADHAQQEGMPFPVLIVVGDGLGVAEAPGAG
jgi:siroheme synthase